MGMIDLHCHILPGIDDGPRGSEESLALAADLVRAGVRTVAATPHLREDYPAVVPSELNDRCLRLAKELHKAGLDLAVVPGGEADLVWALDASDAELCQASYGGLGHDLLIETPYGSLLPNFESQLEEVMARGYRIVLAHPERNPTFQRDPHRLRELVRRGVYLQVTTGALLGSPRRSRSGRFARQLVTEGLAHVIASDAHGSAAAAKNHTGVRTPGWGHALAVVHRLVSAAEAEWLLNDVPRAILLGNSTPPRPKPQRARALRFQWPRLREGKGRFPRMR
jgi:protein-tyrosine phosphatase